MSRLGLVTGGARGIGLGIVRALLQQDVVDEVVVFDVDPAPIDEGKVVAVDVTDDDAVRAAVESVGAVPHVLVNNAGGGRVRPDAPPSVPFDPFGPVEGWRDQIEVNLTSAYIVTRHVAPKMQRGASICSTASIAGLMPGPLYAYGAAKAALIHWTKSISLALAPRGIRANAVAPGFIYTRLWEGLAPDKENFMRVVANSVPLGTEQTPEDIANAVAFLCSERASQITGQVIAIDGGATAGRPPQAR